MFGTRHDLWFVPRHGQQLRAVVCIANGQRRLMHHRGGLIAEKIAKRWSCSYCFLSFPPLPCSCWDRLTGDASSVARCHGERPPSSINSRIPHPLSGSGLTRKSDRGASYAERWSPVRVQCKVKIAADVAFQHKRSCAIFCRMFTFRTATRVGVGIHTVGDL